MTEQVAAPQAPDDLYAHVGDLDADQLIERHPALAKRVDALADQHAAERLAAEQQQAAAQHKQQLYQRATGGDAQAELELLDLTKRELGSVHSQRAAQEAEQALRQRLWLRDASAYGLDGSDPAVLAAAQGATNLKEVGQALERLRDERQQAKASTAATRPATSTTATGGGAARDDELALARRLAANPKDKEAQAEWGRRFRKA